MISGSLPREHLRIICVDKLCGVVSFAAVAYDCCSSRYQFGLRGRVERLFDQRVGGMAIGLPTRV
jgi:hypothetical protein